MRIVPFIGLLLLTACTASRDAEHVRIRTLYRSGDPDDKSHIYTLPYEKNKNYLLVQGYYSSFSHKNGIAVDFKMPPGTPVTAAREGVVVRAKEDGERGGMNRRYRKDANYVVIEHDDGSRAGYWHLKKNGVLVNIGDTVQTGQRIALSGSTGYSALPHLHFIVWTSRNGRWQQLPTRFYTRKGARYLKPMRRYKRTN